jgi:proteasome lid subunit RPN8/RPN11
VSALCLEDPSLPPSLEEVLVVLDRAFPREGCGVVLSGPRGHRVLGLPNAVDPSQAGHHFQFDEARWLAVLTEADARGEAVSCVFHSHIDSPADFSARDVEAAAPGGTPLLPGVTYLVVSVRGEGATEARLFRWSGDFFVEVCRAISAR